MIEQEQPAPDTAYCILCDEDPTEASGPLVETRWGWMHQACAASEPNLEQAESCELPGANLGITRVRVRGVRAIYEYQPWPAHPPSYTAVEFKDEAAAISWHMAQRRDWWPLCSWERGEEWLETGGSRCRYLCDCPLGSVK